MRTPPLLEVFGFLLLFGASPVQAQPGRGPDTPPGPKAEAPQAFRSHVDEPFTLNISRRHFTHKDFSAGTAVEAGNPSQHWSLRVGAAVTAQQIDVRLRQVQGRGRFHGDLRPLLEQVNSRKSPSGGQGSPPRRRPGKQSGSLWHLGTVIILSLAGDHP